MVAVLAILLLAGCGSSADHSRGTASSTATTATSAANARPGACRSDPHEGVHEPQRLKVIKRCATFAGKVVVAPDASDDGDVTFDVAPDPGYGSMLNAKNRQKHGLHVEIVPMDQPGCKPGQPIVRAGFSNLGVCSGADVVSPPLGAHIRAFGPYVYDSWQGWNEIHPAWKVDILPPRR